MGYPVRPSGYVGWGSTGMTNVAEPTDAKKSYGWGVNEQPASSYFNWIAQKQDEWIQYLSWKSQLEPIVDTDFDDATPNSVATYDLAPVGNSGYLPLWNKSPTHAYGGYGQVTIGDAAAAGDGASYLAYIEKTITPPKATHDFILESLIQWSPGASRGEMVVGWPTGPIAFVATGQSAFWGIRYKPSGVAQTSMGMSLVASSGYSRFAIESRGATMVVLVNGQQIYAVPRASVDETPASFGVYMRHPSGLTWGLGHVDKLTYKIRRPV